MFDGDKIGVVTSSKKISIKRGTMYEVSLGEEIEEIHGEFFVKGAHIKIVGVIKRADSGGRSDLIENILKDIRSLDINDIRIVIDKVKLEFPMLFVDELPDEIAQLLN